MCEGACCTWNERDCCWKCLRRWHISPEELCCDMPQVWLAAFIPTTIAVFLMLVFGCYDYVQELSPPSYFIETTQIPVWINNTFSLVQPTDNCSVTFGNLTVVQQSCTNLSQSTFVSPGSLCAFTSCLKYQQTCFPCYYNCFTNDCWVPQQQENCLKSTSHFNCTMNYDGRTTYSCSNSPNSSMPICQKDCPDFQCQPPADYSCNCINDYCLNYQNKICSYDRVYYYNMHLFYQYTDGKIFHDNNVIKKMCQTDDSECQVDFLKQYQPMTIWYNENNSSMYITSWTPNQTAGTIAMIVLGAIYGFCVFIVYCLFGCIICSSCKCPKLKPRKQLPLSSPNPQPDKAVQVNKPEGLRLSFASKEPVQKIEMTIDKYAMCFICHQSLEGFSMRVMECRHICHEQCNGFGQPCPHPSCNPKKIIVQWHEVKQPVII